VTLGGAAWSAGNSSPPVALTFDDAAQQVTLTIPTPACAPDHPDCKWVLFVNEPDVAGKPVVGSVTGTTGVLAVEYPHNFCGVLQADARTGPPWTQVYGLRHTVEGDCPPPTTTTTVPPTTTTTETPPTVPPSVTATTEPPPVQKVVPPVVIATSTPPPVPATVPATTPAPTQLPFTGVNTKPLLFLGLTLVALGLCLINTKDSWRRMVRRLMATIRWSLATAVR
jgi:hypothetical protein